MQDAQGAKKPVDRRILGTPNYIAPEVLAGENPTAASDFWAVGIVLYEFLYGVTPFNVDESNDEDNIFRKILSEEPEFPPNEISPEAEDLIRHFLIKDKNQRLTKIDDIVAHPFFRGFDWKNIYRKKPQIVPNPIVIQDKPMFCDCTNWIDQVLEKTENNIN